MKTPFVAAHPNHESKSGKAPYGAFAKKNFSTTELRDVDDELITSKRFRVRQYLNQIKNFFTKKKSI